MNEKISSQEMKLTFLQKKVDSIAAAMNDVSKMLSSLEGKINEDKGKDFQSFLKGKKNKLMQSLTQLKVPEKKKMLKTFIDCPILLLNIYRENSFLVSFHNRRICLFLRLLWCLL